MSKHYPYITCKKKGKCLRLEWRVDWFQGNCEFETVCRECYWEAEKKRRKKENIRLKREFKAQEKAWQEKMKRHAQMMERLRAKFDIKELTMYQIRVNGTLDIYPTGGKYHDIRRNKRGSYSGTEEEFIERYLITTYEEDEN